MPPTRVVSDDHDPVEKATKEPLAEVSLYLRILIELVKRQNYPLTEADDLAVRQARDTLSLHAPQHLKEDPYAAEEGTQAQVEE